MSTIQNKTPGVGEERRISKWSFDAKPLDSKGKKAKAAQSVKTGNRGRKSASPANPIMGDYGVERWNPLVRYGKPDRYAHCTFTTRIPCTVGEILTKLYARDGKGGVYKIECGGEVYVGISRNILYRWRQHIHEMRLGKHPNQRMQELHDQHGPDAFTFTVLEFCDPDGDYSREVHWMRKLKPSLNEPRAVCKCPNCGTEITVRNQILHIASRRRRNASAFSSPSASEAAEVGR